MNWKHAGIGLVIAAALVGCNNNDGNNNDIGRNNVGDNHRYNNNLNDPDGVLDNRNHDGRNIVNDRDGMNGDNRNNVNDVNRNDHYDVNKKAADRIVSQVRGIDRAYVLTTDNNAYVAAGLDENQDGKNVSGKELTDDVKHKISDIVKSTDNSIDNVYVTTNPDFANLVNNYQTDLNNGRPIGGFFDQIGNMIDRVFPGNNR